METNAGIGGGISRNGVANTECAWVDFVWQIYPNKQAVQKIFFGQPVSIIIDTKNNRNG